MSLELSKVVAASFLAHAKHEKDTSRAMSQRYIASAKEHYANYLRAVKTAAKHQQESSEWVRVIEDLKNYEPDREMIYNLDEMVELIRKEISKGKDVPLEGLIPDE